MKHGNSISCEKLIEINAIKSGGTLNKRLNELEAAGFIQSFLPYGSTKRDRCYRVIDEFSLFHLRWIEPYLSSGVTAGAQGYWQHLVKMPAVSSWAGYVFETICVKHIAQIRKALKLETVACKVGSWQFLPKKGSKLEGVQIDLLLNRQDGIITLCEIKYSEYAFVIDKEYGKKLMQKSAVFEQQFKKTKQILLAFITTMGLKHSLWSEELVSQEVILDDLFVVI